MSSDFHTDRLTYSFFFSELGSVYFLAIFSVEDTILHNFQFNLSVEN